MLVCTSLSLLLTFSKPSSEVARPGASLEALATDPQGWRHWGIREKLKEMGPAANSSPFVH